MMKRTHFRVVFGVLLVGIITLLLSGCDKIKFSYKPPFLPVKLVVDSQGNVSVVGEVSIVTFVGEFSIGAEYILKNDPDSIMVIIREREKGSLGIDTIYRVRTSGDKFMAVLNGNTVVQVENNQVLIDVTNATVESIEFKRVDNTIPETEYEKDYIPVTVIKTIIVFCLLFFSIIATFFTGLIDLILVLFGANFPVTTALWSFAWQTVTINWYWNHADTIGIVIGGLIILIIIASQFMLTFMAMK